MTIAIIGRGLIGSAAARHLTAQGHSVILIGPPEPESRTGVLTPGSHWDEGRISRQNATHPFWAEISTASIRRYAEIEAKSGISFFTEAGAMMAGPSESAFFQSALATSKAHTGQSEHLTSETLAQLFPFFAFSPSTEALYEAKSAGHISPRRLVAAQTKIATAQGATLLPEPMTAFRETSTGVEITTPTQTLEADEILIATGGMSDHLLPEPLGLKVYARTVAFFEVSAEEVHRLANMPSLVFRLETTEVPYLLPPIRYPDGKIYLKLGGDPEDIQLTTAQEIHDWYKTEGSPHVRDHLHQMITTLMPDLQIRTTSSASCMTTFSRSGGPIITRLTPRLTVATAGNGAGAKCSDELGRLAASALLNQPEHLLTKLGATA